MRTKFLLRHVHDQDLRKRTCDQPDKLESSHQLARAVFYGQNGPFRYAGKEEQQVADACKRLVQNVIVCRNCLYLTQQPSQAPPAEQRTGPGTAAIARMSPGSRRHINLQEEVNFSAGALSDALRFDLGAPLTAEG